MVSYEFLAGSYDALTLDVDYPRWADYVEGHFRRLKRPVETVLDLACGTGSLTYELSGRGYTLTGVDLSADMLSLAEEKCRGLENRPQFFCQGMEALRLPGRVDACVCCLDSVNYVLQPQKLRRAFRRVYEHLHPERKDDAGECRQSVLLVWHTNGVCEAVGELWVWNRIIEHPVMLADFGAWINDGIAGCSLGGNIWRNFLALQILHQDRLMRE